MAPKTETRILYWNANGGVINKTPELLHLLKSEAINILLINETHLIPSDVWRVAGYAVVRTDRQRASRRNRGGGTAVLVHNSVSFTQEFLLPLQTIEATSIMVHTKQGPLRCAAIYSPPRSVYHPSDIEALIPDNTPSILAGDLNAKHIHWNSTKNCPRGEAILDHTIDFNVKVLGPVDPTYHHHLFTTPSDVLDIALFKNVRCSHDIATIQALTSDHDPVMILLGNTYLHATPKTRLLYSKADWQRFRSHIHARLQTPFDKLDSTDQIDESVSLLTSTIRKAADISIPIVTTTPPDFLTLPKSITHCIAMKNRARRHWQAFRTPDTRSEYNRLSAILRRDIKHFRHLKWQEKLSTLTVHDKTIWPMAKALQKRGTPNPPLITARGIALNSLDKAEAIADVLERAFTPNEPDQSTPDLGAHMEQVLSTAVTAAVPHEVLCTPEELVSILKSLNPRKAPGPDLVSSRLLLQLPGTAVARLFEIINSSINLGYFPRAWKAARVVSILKPGKPPTDPTSYRPISLLNVLAKVLERVIQTRLKAFITAKNIIPACQFGFVEGTSTEHQLLRLVNKITQGFNTKLFTAVAFLDVAKAFDKVWHDGLLYKLAENDCPPYLLVLLHSFLSNRTFVATWMGSASFPRSILAGVPQGSVLSPTLFNVYTSDLPKLPAEVVVHLFADDDALAASSSFLHLAVAKLQKGLNVIAPWYSKWRLGLNVEKTSATIFSKRKVSSPPMLVLSGRHIIWKPSNPYLGTMLDAKLTWKSHIDITYKKAVKKIAALSSLLYSSNIARPDRIHIYKQIIRPTITYACPIWGGTAQTHIDRLQTLQNRALRIITHSPKFTPIYQLHQDANIPLLQDHIIHLSRSFYKALNANPHPEVRQQLKFLPDRSDKHSRPISSFGPPFNGRPINRKRRLIDHPKITDACGPLLPAKKRRV